MAEKVLAAKAAGHEVVVVVSAMGKTTENLLALAREAAARRRALPRRELDMLVSTGERVTMALLSIAIQARGYEAISFTGSQSGIITNDRHFDARIIEVRAHRIEDELARGRIVIVAGYQGMSYKREITTLGRGGSDTTAVALAAALGAERCEIYSDVDGVYSADPRSVPVRAASAELDYSMMQEMAESGAKVLNAQAVEWAKRHRVVIHARRTSDSSGRGSIRARNDRGSAAAMLRLRTSAPWSRNAGSCSCAHRQRRPARCSKPRRPRASCCATFALLEGAAIACAPLLERARSRASAARARAPYVAGLELESGFGSVSLIGVDVGSAPDTARPLRCERWSAAADFDGEHAATAELCSRRGAHSAPRNRPWHACFVGGETDERLSA